jgi:outer membrane protein assembly factor BamB
MRFLIGKSRSLRFPLLVAIVLLIGLFLIGCARAPVRGWSGPVVAGDRVYVGTIKGEVVGLNNSTGIQEWRFALEGSGSTGSFLGCAGQISTAMSIYSTPAAKEVEDSIIIYAGDYDGNVYGIVTGTQMVSKFETDGPIVGSPTIADDTLFIGSSDNNLYAISLDSWGKKWVFETGDKIWSTPAIDDGVVYIGSSDHNLYAIDAESGAEIWHFEAEGAILSTPLVVDGTVYIGSSDRNFYAIDVNQVGKEAEAKGVFEGAGNWFWTQALAYDNVIYVGNLDHRLYALDAGNIENKLWEFETEGMIRTPPVLVKGLIVVGSEDGHLYAIDPGTKAMRDFNLETPILAPLYADTENGIVYTHAQDGEHALYAIDVESGAQLWKHVTSE